jgi:hypothetical protein
VGRPLGDAGAHRNAPAVRDRDGRDELAESLGDAGCLVGAPTGHDDGELLSADPARDVVLPADLAGRGGDRLQHLVAGEMAERRVQAAEVVDVVEEDADGRSAK